mmetsp:Transcript_37292/g.51131  ORF Transcript_37292/g.51131 Transcript_37292/m.51131 type:complete len:83 (-) Transcript_37292:183-431(-)
MPSLLLLKKAAHGVRRASAGTMDRLTSQAREDAKAKATAKGKESLAIGRARIVGIWSLHRRTLVECAALLDLAKALLEVLAP